MMMMIRSPPRRDLSSTKFSRHDFALAGLFAVAYGGALRGVVRGLLRKF